MDVPVEMTVPLSYEYTDLSSIVDTNERGFAYFAQFFVPKLLVNPKRDNDRPTHTAVQVIGSKELIQDVVSWLLNNPSTYIDLIRGFIPVKDFPNVNRGILSPPFLSVNGLVVDDYTNMVRINVNL